MGKLFVKKIVVYFLLTFVFSMLMPNIYAKADEKYDVTINYGIDGKYKATKYIPVTVSVNNLAENFSGEIEVRVASDSQGGYDAYAKEVSGSAGESIEVMIPVKFLEDANKATVCLISGNKVVYEKNLVISTGRVSEGNALTGLLTDDPTALGYMGDIIFQTTYNNVAKMDTINLNNSDVLSNYLNMDGLDIIIINNYNMANLSADEYDSLNGWVSNGGTLVIGAGANDSKTINNIDSNFLNIKSNGNKEVNTIYSNLIISELDIPGADIDSTSGGTNLIYSLERGEGEIFITTFDLGLEPFISDANAGNLISMMLEETFTKVYDSSNNGGYWQGSYQISNLLTYIPVDNPLNIFVLISILVVYCLVVGIISYLVLKAINKRELSWIVLPLLAIGFTGIIYMAGNKMKVKDFVINSANIVNVDDNGKGYVNSYLGVMRKYKSELVVEKPADLDMQYTNFGGYYYYYGDGDQGFNNLRVKTTYRNNNLDYTFSESQASDMKTFKVAGNEIILPKIETQFNIVNGKLNGTVKNNLDSDINNLILTIGDSIWELGQVKKGEEININQKEVASAYGLSTYADNIQSDYYNARWDSSKNIYDEKYKGILRTSNMISAVSSVANITNGANLIAITNMPVDYDLNIGTKNISKYDITAIIQDVSVSFKDEAGFVSLPSGFVKEKLVYADQNVEYPSYDNSYIYGIGDIVFDYVIDDNIEATEITVHQALDRWGYQYGLNNEFSIYNYNTNTFEDINLGLGDYTINNLENYYSNNSIRIKITLEQNKGDTIIPKISVKGVER